jgi:hypothetical protein
MVHFLIKRGHDPEPEQKSAAKQTSKVWDLQSYLYNLWLGKMAMSKLYDDEVSHRFGRRNCDRILKQGCKK